MSVQPRSTPAFAIGVGTSDAALFHAARAVLVAAEVPRAAGVLRGPLGTSLRLLGDAVRLVEATRGQSFENPGHSLPGPGTHQSSTLMGSPDRPLADRPCVQALDPDAGNPDAHPGRAQSAVTPIAATHESTTFVGPIIAGRFGIGCGPELPPIDRSGSSP